jgi:hypothetical protein
MRYLLLYLLVLFINNWGPVKAANISYSTSAQILVVSEVSLGETVRIREADLAPLIVDIQNDTRNIDGTIFIRVFFKTADRNRIENIIKNASARTDFAEPLIILEKTPDSQAVRTRVKYAQVDRSRPVNSSLVYNLADSVQYLNNIDKYTFSIKNFTEIERNSIVTFQLDIYNVWNYSGDLELKFRLANEPDPASIGSGGGTGGGGTGGGGTGGGGTTDTGSSSAIALRLKTVSERINLNKNLLNRNFVCEPEPGLINPVDICSAVELETLSGQLASRIVELRTNRNFFESLSLELRSKRRNNEIGKQTNRSLQNQIQKARNANTNAVKDLNAMKTRIDNVRRQRPNLFRGPKSQNALQGLKSSAQLKINRLDSLVRIQIATQLLDLGMIDQATFASL